MVWLAASLIGFFPPSAWEASVAAAGRGLAGVHASAVAYAAEFERSLYLGWPPEPGGDRAREVVLFHCRLDALRLIRGLPDPVRALLEAEGYPAAVGVDGVNAGADVAGRRAGVQTVVGEDYREAFPDAAAALAGTPALRRLLTHGGAASTWHGPTLLRTGPRALHAARYQPADASHRSEIIISPSWTLRLGGTGRVLTTTVFEVFNHYNGRAMTVLSRLVREGRIGRCAYVRAVRDLEWIAATRLRAFYLAHRRELDAASGGSYYGAWARHRVRPLPCPRWRVIVRGAPWGHYGSYYDAEQIYRCGAAGDWWGAAVWLTRLEHAWPVDGAMVRYAARQRRFVEARASPFGPADLLLRSPRAAAVATLRGIEAAPAAFAAVAVALRAGGRPW